MNILLLLKNANGELLDADNESSVSWTEDPTNIIIFLLALVVLILIIIAIRSKKKE